MKSAAAATTPPKSTRGRKAKPPLPSLPPSDPAPSPAVAAVLSNPVRYNPKPEPVRVFTPGRRPLREIPRHEARQLEVRLHYMRRVHNLTDRQISHELDVRPEDLDALARTCGQP